MTLQEIQQEIQSIKQRICCLSNAISELSGGSVTLSASNGLSVSTDAVLGQDQGQSGSPASLISNREIPTEGFTISLLHNSNDDVPDLEFDHTYTSGNPVFLRVKSPNAGTGGATPYEWRQQSTSNGDGTYNNVMQWGFNIGQSVAATRGTWYAQEPNYLTGGTRYVENHLIYVNGGGEASRLFSHTLQELGTGSLADARGQWDFRAETFAYWTLDNTQYGSLTFNKTNNNATFLLQSPAGGIPILSLNDGVNVANLYNTSQALVLDNVGFKANGRTSNGNQIEINNGSASLSASLAFIRSGGQGYQMAVAGASVGGGLGGKFFLFDSKNSHVNFLIKENGSVQIGNDAIVAGNDSQLQVFGDFSTADPGSGIGKWKLGKLVTAAVTADTTRYLEVNVDGTVYKLIIST